jgi:magnesium chelatase family protein
MSLAVVMSRALDGLEAPVVHVEVQLANGLPSFTLAGLADTEVKEACERCCSGIEAVGQLPGNASNSETRQPLSGPSTSACLGWQEVIKNDGGYALAA